MTLQPLSKRGPEQWMLLARQGDAAALGLLLENYRQYLELLARLEIGRRLQHKVDYSDVIQETFLEAHRNFKLFRGSGEAEFVAWLRSILSARLANLVRHYVGTQGRDIRREQAMEINVDQSSRMLDGALVAMGSSPSQAAVRREMGLLLAEALAHLPDDYREVIVMRHLEEVTFSEIATRMDRSLDSVQKLWVRALAKLRLLMKDAM